MSAQRSKLAGNRGAYATADVVAQLAGVSRTTVFRALNESHALAPDTLLKVQAAVAATGYYPDQAARALRGTGTQVIGLVVPNLADPAYSGYAESIHTIAKMNNSLLAVVTTGGHTKGDLEALQMLTRQRVKGIIMAPSGWDSVLARLVRGAPMPMVLLERPLLHPYVSSVLPDDFAGAKVAVQHLVQHGYNRILCLGGEPALYTTQERLRGYREGMKWVQLQPNIVNAVLNPEIAERAILDFLTRRSGKDAILTLSHSITIDVFRSLQKPSVNARVGLLGFGDFPLANALRPSISVVAQQTAKLGYSAAQLMFEQIRTWPDRSRKQQRHIVLETPLVCRDSCRQGLPMASSATPSEHSYDHVAETRPRNTRSW